MSQETFSSLTAQKPIRILIGFLAFYALQSKAALPDYASVLLTGGQGTFVTADPTVWAYRNPAQNLTEEQSKLHLTGDALFEMNFSDDPERPEYGLGPVFNNQSCTACHARDGRGMLPVMGRGENWTQLLQNESIFLRMSIENGKKRTFNATDNWGAPVPVPGFGTQLFHLGSFRLRLDFPGVGQAQVFIKLAWTKFTYPDGTTVELRKPLFKIENPYDQVFNSVTGTYTSRLFESDVRLSPRMSPPMIGLGLLEAVREQDILALARRDLSAWGISGKPNWVIDRQKELAKDPYPISLGRFGLKSSTPSVYHQSLGALNGDIGVSNPAFPEESIGQTPLFESFIPHWKPGLEASAEISDAIVFYSQTLAVPSRRNIDDPFVQKGAENFEKVGCALCHQPSFITGSHPIAAMANQRIYPFSDMLLHDMGDDLADGRTDFQADGREWRTRPLWGIGLNQVVNPRAGYLHDGRARTLEEAILWHDGEAKKSKVLFTKLTKENRDSLIEFLNSL